MFSSCISLRRSTESLKKKLCHAIVKQDADNVRSLLALDTPVDFLVTQQLCSNNLPMNWNSLPLVHFAAMLARDNIEILNQIISAGAGLEEISENDNIENSGTILQNVLTMHTHLPTFQLLIEKGAAINAVNSKRLSFIQSLLATAPLNQSNDTGQTTQNKLVILSLLINHNAILTEADIKSMFELITKSEFLTSQTLNLFSQCIDKKINLSPGPNSTILHYLINYPPSKKTLLEDLVNKIIATGIDVNQQNEKGQTALHLSIIRKSAIFNCLAATSNVNIPDVAGLTPLHLAAQAGASFVTELLNYNPDLKALDNDKRTIMHYAKDQFVFELLKSHDAEVDNADNNGVTPLMRATEAGKLQLMEKLLRAGANIKAIDNNGDNILFYASTNVKTINYIRTRLEFMNFKDIKLVMT